MEKKYNWNCEFNKELKDKLNKALLELEKIDDTPKIKRNYKFFQHPIKWFKDIKKIKVLNQLQRAWWKKNKELIYKAQQDIALYGTAVINKNNFK